MENSSIDAREQLMLELERSDQDSREMRAGRIEWLSQYRRLPGIIMGRSETLRILSEAAEAFVFGQFVAALVLATAVIEHALLEELQDQGLVKKSCTFEQAIKLAAAHQVLEAKLLHRVDDLRLKRNPFAHLTREGHAQSMGVRFRAQKVHPITMIENDAKEALQVMYEVFLVTLKELS